MAVIPPCLPTKAPTPPSIELWLHEIKHDGFRAIARKQGSQVRLYSRPGNDLTYRFTLIVEALARLRSKSCIIDGEALACEDDGMPSFNRIRYRRHDESVFLVAVREEVSAAFIIRQDAANRKSRPLKSLMILASFCLERSLKLINSYNTTDCMPISSDPASLGVCKTRVSYRSAEWLTLWESPGRPRLRESLRLLSPGRDRDHPIRAVARFIKGLDRNFSSEEGQPFIPVDCE